MEIKQEIIDFFQVTADFASGIQRRLTWFLGIALLASLSLCWLAYSSTSALWWNITKCGLLLLPILVWAAIWMILGQLREGPQLAATLAARKDLSVTQSVARLKQSKPTLIGLFSTIREIRNNESFEVVTGTIGSVTLLANPLFAIFSFAMLVILWILIVISLLLWLF